MRLVTMFVLAVWPPLAYCLFWALKQAGSLFYADFTLAWYNLNHAIITSVPGYGRQIDAVLQSNYSNGDITYWFLWYGLLLLLWPTRLVWRRWYWARAALVSIGAAFAASLFFAIWPILGPMMKPFFS